VGRATAPVQPRSDVSGSLSCRSWLRGLLLPSLRIRVDRDFDTAIQLPPTLGVIDSDRLGLVAANCLQPRRAHALRGEVIPRCRCASLGERLVVGTDKSVATVCALVRQPRIASGWYDARVGSDDPASLDHANQEDDDGDDE
jgi:hypothetical protein